MKMRGKKLKSLFVWLKGGSRLYGFLSTTADGSRRM